jgi:dienelactone hydrolase
VRSILNPRIILRTIVGAALAPIALLASGSASAQEVVPPLPPGIIGVPGGTGPHSAIAEVDPGLPGHTLYRPARWPKKRLPVVLWGNGGCRDNGLGNARFLREIASHGYLVVAVGHARREEPMRPPPVPTIAPVVPTGAPGGAGPGPGADETRASQLVEGLDWAITENGRRGSARFRRVDTKAVAVMGHSCGGLQAIAVASDPRIRTTMIWNSGVYNRGPGTGRSGINVTKDQLRSVRGPIAYINGGPSDIAYVNALDDFDRIDHVPALFAWLPVGHGGTFYTAPDGGAYGRIAVDWLNWQLKGNREARRVFAGPKCGLCADPAWTVQRKGL